MVEEEDDVADWDNSDYDDEIDEPNNYAKAASRYHQIPRNIEIGMGGRAYHYAPSSEDDMESEDMEAGYSDIQNEEEEAQRIADEEDE